MPRKFRLGRHRKNEFTKKKLACTLVVEHVPVPQGFILLQAPSGDALSQNAVSKPEMALQDSCEEGLSTPATVPISLVVSVPLDTLMSTSAPTLEMMQYTIRILSALPPGMSSLHQ